MGRGGFPVEFKGRVVWVHGGGRAGGLWFNTWRCFPRHQVQIAGNGQTYIRVANCQTVRMKEEKEVLEHFAGVFTMMNPLTFKEIFQTTVPYMVERISKNYALQVYTAFCCRRFVFSLFVVLND